MIHIRKWSPGPPRFIKNTQKSIENIETDIMDYDGIGNYGRIPDKNPKKL